MTQAQHNIAVFLASLNCEEVDSDTSGVEPSSTPKYKHRLPTPEQMKDTGSVDGISVITPERWKKMKARRAKKVITAKPRRVSWAPPKNPGAGRPSKPVICLDTGRVFPSPGEAGRFVGTGAQAVRQAIYAGSKCRGLRWEFKDTAREREAA